MSIDRINRPTYINAYNATCNKNVDKVAKAKDVDRIEISEIGKNLKNYSLESTTTNAKRIAEIKDSIENGTYNVDARLTAKSLLNAMKEQNE